MRQGRFREDLYYRLNVLPIVLPPLRERGEDIPRLVHFYIDSYNTEFKKRVRGIHPEAMKYLEAYAWPGNIRELRNAIERAMLLAEGDTLVRGDFPASSSSPLRLGDRVELASAASISSNSNAHWWSRRSSAPAGIKPKLGAGGESGI